MSRFEIQAPGPMRAEAQLFTNVVNTGPFAVLRMWHGPDQVTIYLPADRAAWAEAVAAAINAPVPQVQQVAA